jgi:isopenicillin N synthase-like dioxygenase
MPLPGPRESMLDAFASGGRQNRAMLESVPVLDFATARAGSFAAGIRQAFERFGFAVLANHGIEQDLITRFLGVYREFFAWPEQRKRAYTQAGMGGARGYTPFGIETAKGATHHDLKEFWHVGRELPQGSPLRRYMPPNVWVNGIADFESVSLAMFRAFDAVGLELLRAIARSLQLGPGYFDDKVDQGNSVLRIIHYPPMPATPTMSVRAAAHEDINVITLLLGAEEPGLQLLTRQGEWLAVDPAPGTLVINVGDMLQRLTNNVLRSTSHRVINPPRERAANARFSMPFFLHFNPQFTIRSLPQCVQTEGVDHYPDSITADDYLQQRLREIKLK